jgi:hypothetical protein
MTIPVFIRGFVTNYSHMRQNQFCVILDEPQVSEQAGFEKGKVFP